MNFTSHIISLDKMTMSYEIIGVDDRGTPLYLSCLMLLESIAAFHPKADVRRADISTLRIAAFGQERTFPEQENPALCQLKLDQFSQRSCCKTAVKGHSINVDFWKKGFYSIYMRDT